MSESERGFRAIDKNPDCTGEVIFLGWDHSNVDGNVALCRCKKCSTKLEAMGNAPHRWNGPVSES